MLSVASDADVHIGRVVATPNSQGPEDEEVEETQFVGDEEEYDSEEDAEEKVINISILFRIPMH